MNSLDGNNSKVVLWDTRQKAESLQKNAKWAFLG